MQEIEETRRIAQREMGLILPSVEAVIPPQEFVWDRAKLYPKQEAAIFERKRISVIVLGGPKEHPKRIGSHSQGANPPTNNITLVSSSRSGTR